MRTAAVAFVLCLFCPTAHAVLGRADLAFNRIAGAQAEFFNLRWGHVNIVGTWQIIRFRRAQKSETVLQNFQNALAENRDIVFRKLL